MAYTIITMSRRQIITYNFNLKGTTLCVMYLGTNQKCPHYQSVLAFQVR